MLARATDTVVGFSRCRARYLWLAWSDMVKNLSGHNTKNVSIGVPVGNRIVSLDANRFEVGKWRVRVALLRRLERPRYAVSLRPLRSAKVSSATLAGTIEWFHVRRIIGSVRNR
ncbi:hypothetical protein HBI81_116560 [Parastagonospora nodorum]|nr:hypothetical protein HBI09_125260 [Parastagonospora nodorum]KAH5002369.1 hypothetical protein HBI77_136200 [Parastagonospora nodorum]KAH5113851.1 hypothetical protein HBH71_151390 [Parastagonospora nodorum]KAH5693305.1 hypothetical protein HBI44_154340 [Parastagonospora nodorum]KAH6452229.1 hypothetical protein HBI57_166160 [Parastagonospora nodorum]